MFGAGSLFGEYVFMKDGQIREGTIIAENAASVVLRTAEKKREVIPRRDIMRLLYTELYMGRVYVQKADGKGIVGYMVDEDRKTYTFRKELYRPEEFTLKREEVLFIARRNPSGLQGEAETDRIRLKWQPPYNQVDTYKIYLKGPADPKFRVLDDTGSRRFTVEDLKSNTEYMLYVTAVAREGDESMPSNEITVKTKNIPPPAPENVRVHDGRTANVRIGSTGKIIMQWDPVRDVDGTVKEYRIYNVRNDPPVRIGTAAVPSYGLPANYSDMRVAVRAVDNNGDEGDERVLFTESWLHLRFGATGAVPYNTLGELVDYGYGGTAGIYVSGLLFSAFAFGVDGGYVRWACSHDRLCGMYMVPVSFWAGLRFRLFERLVILPGVHGGMVGLNSQYECTGSDGCTLEQRDKTGWDGLAGGSLSLEWDMNERFFLFLRGEYTVIIEKDENQPFAAVTAGIGVHLL